jgi:hypothetical protein
VSYSPRTKRTRSAARHLFPGSLSSRWSGFRTTAAGGDAGCDAVACSSDEVFGCCAWVCGLWFVERNGPTADIPNTYLLRYVPRITNNSKCCNNEAGSSHGPSVRSLNCEKVESGPKSRQRELPMYRP